MTLFWNLIAWIVSWPSVANYLMVRAHQKPYRHIGNYMHRFWLMPDWMLTRDDDGALVPKGWIPFAIRINHIQRPDADPYLHDHPWNWRTIILRGWYIEENVEGQPRAYNPGDTRSASAETLHRISNVSEGGVWTLFITGRRFNRWGFVLGEPPRKTYYRDYTSVNERGEVQVPQS